MPKLHLRDSRFRNNAGMDFPLCYAQGETIDMDKGRLPTTAKLADATCLRCRRVAAKAHPWGHARFGIE